MKNFLEEKNLMWKQIGDQDAKRKSLSLPYCTVGQQREALNTLTLFHCEGFIIPLELCVGLASQVRG